MSNFDYSTYNVFDVLYHLQRGSVVTCPFYERPPTLHVYGAFLLNAWRKRNIKVENALKKLKKIKKNCSSAEKKLKNTNVSIEKVETESQVIFKTIISLRNETIVAQQALETLTCSNAKLQEDRKALYEDINDRSSILEEKKETAQQIEKKTKNMIAQREHCKAELSNLINDIEDALQTNDQIQRYIDKTKSTILKDLDNLKYEAENKAKDLMKEMKQFSEIADKYAAKKSNVDRLVLIVNELEEKRAGCCNIKKSASLGLVGSLPWLWSSLMDIFYHSKRLFNNNDDVAKSRQFREISESANTHCKVNDFEKKDCAGMVRKSHHRPAIKRSCCARS